MDKKIKKQKESNKLTWSAPILVINEVSVTNGKTHTGTAESGGYLAPS